MLTPHRRIPEPSGRGGAGGFAVHAAVTVAPDDLAGRERLLHYSSARQPPPGHGHSQATARVRSVRGSCMAVGSPRLPGMSAGPAATAPGLPSRPRVTSRSPRSPRPTAISPSSPLARLSLPPLARPQPVPRPALSCFRLPNPRTHCRITTSACSSARSPRAPSLTAADCASSSCRSTGTAHILRSVARRCSSANTPALVFDQVDQDGNLLSTARPPRRPDDPGAEPSRKVRNDYPPYVVEEGGVRAPRCVTSGWSASCQAIPPRRLGRTLFHRFVLMRG